MSASQEASQTGQSDGSVERRGIAPEFRAYLLANVAFLVPAGLVTVIFPWLLVVTLHETPERVGIAQMITQLPALLLLLPAGFIADRIEQRRILMVTNVLVAISQLAIAVLIAVGALTFNALIALALFGGVAGVFSGPPRDALLSRVAGEQIQRAVVLVIGLQFGSQIIGYGMASAADRIGAPVLLIACAAMFAWGVWPCSALPSSEPAPATGRHPLREIGVGVGFALASDRIRPVLILTLALGMFFVGTYFVLFPLIIRDVYHGGAAELSLAFAANMTGTLVVIGALMRRNSIERQGRAFMIALLFGSLVLLLLYLRPPYWAFLVLSFVWGLGGGLTMTMGRSIVQESAPPDLTARLLSIYAFAMSAGIPIGALAIGYAAQAWGTLNAALLPGLGMVVTVALVHLNSNCWALLPYTPPQPTAETAIVARTP